ncbi:MAG: RecX family transcriptional regulator [Ardenticatenaceae bacterium]|nr:RecX family transcriptional regulator [Ardenticatenaceae bacterium]MCB8986261.1 RecX family transcriptional regulator [Ardenticatenaceae bacterium]
MGIITALSAQKRSQDRVNVYLDGEFAFGLAAMAAARLRVGQTLTAADIAALQEVDAVEKAKESALRYLGYRPRSQVEIQRHLQKKGYTETTIAAVIERLTAVDLLNDETFARYWVEQRETFKPRGQLALRQELQQKGIDSKIIDRVLSELDETAAAEQVAEKKAGQLTGLAEADFKRKLGQYLQRRGFPYDIIRAAVDEWWTKTGLPAAPPAHEDFD